MLVAPSHPGFRQATNALQVLKQGYLPCCVAAKGLAALKTPSLLEVPKIARINLRLLSLLKKATEDSLL
jgi:hypothetical protein